MPRKKDLAVEQSILTDLHRLTGRCNIQAAQISELNQRLDELKVLYHELHEGGQILSEHLEQLRLTVETLSCDPNTNTEDEEDERVRDVVVWMTPDPKYRHLPRLWLTNAGAWRPSLADVALFTTAEAKDRVLTLAAEDEDSEKCDVNLQPGYTGYKYGHRLGAERWYNNYYNRE